MQPRFTYQMCFAWHERPFSSFSILSVVCSFFAYKGNNKNKKQHGKREIEIEEKQSENAIRETVDSKSESEMKLTQNPYAEQFH